MQRPPPTRPDQGRRQRPCAGAVVAEVEEQPGVPGPAADLDSGKRADPRAGGRPAGRGRGAREHRGRVLSPRSGPASVAARAARPGRRATYVQGCWLDWPTPRAGAARHRCGTCCPDARLEPRRARTRRSPRRGAPPGHAARAARPGRRRRRRPRPRRPRSALARRRLGRCSCWPPLSVAALLQRRAGPQRAPARVRLRRHATSCARRSPRSASTPTCSRGAWWRERRSVGEYLERLRAEAQRLAHLVENVLFYSRLESGRAGAVRESIDAQRVPEGDGPPPRGAGGTGRACTLVRRRRRGRRAAPRCARTGSALEQILENLVDNACQYAAPLRALRSIDVRLRAQREPRPLARARPRPRPLRERTGAGSSAPSRSPTATRRPARPGSASASP